ncbi:MAG: hypothetical protein GC153_13600 [Alphaproteobacteria bacterium]|nr:hypothetical protein [Alphaproteobacteria bacterium]
MAKRLDIVILVALAASGPAIAAGPVAVTGGEHDGFSRVVVSTGAESVSLDPRRRQVDIALQRDAGAADLSDINGAHKPSRVAGAAEINGPTGPVIRVTLNCDCALATSQLPDGRFVLDISDASAAKTASATATESQTEASGSDAATGAPQVLTNVEPPKRDETKHAADEGEDASFDEARKRMLKLLQRAADDGLVTIRSGAGGTAAIAAAQTPFASSSEENTAPPPVEKNKPCLPDSAFAINGEPFKDKPLVAISELQAQLAHASPQEQSDIVKKLADGYLSIAFGDEALTLLSGNNMGGSLAADMARAIAEREEPDNGPLLGAVGCRGAHALWQAAAMDPKEADEALKRAGDAIDALPARLKAYLATRFARKLIVASDWDAAQRYFVIASKAAGSPSDDLKYVAAKLLEHDGKSDESEKLLKSIAARDSDAAKDALLALAERYRAGEEPHKGFVDDIGALATTDRGTPRGAEAAYDEAMDWAKRGDIESSVMLLAHAALAAPKNGPSPAEAARNLLADAFTSGDEKQQTPALSAYLAHRKFVDSAGDDPVFIRQAAEAARAVGLPNVALEILNGNQAGRDRATMLDKAEAALASGDADAALAAAAPYADDPRFAKIVVEANLRLNRESAALAAATAISEPREKARLVARAAWRAGDWDSAVRGFRLIDPAVMTEREAAQYALAAYMTGARKMPPAAEAVLTKANSGALESLEALFAAPPEGRIIDRGKAAVKNAVEEINKIKEATLDG